ncbi:eclosion hormone [Melitaea cinxia]|uniref:eclosion hormone n=1 Tax=Melitaea cinxia TaxID=113334 RepID=UPI0004EA9CF7|nr:eclosion hormone [Melitaea cinxia]
MVGKFSSTFAVFTVAVFISSLDYINTNPAIATGYDPLEICIENCALCKKMLGAWFEGPLCAESCIKYKGKLVPECEDYASIAPFLNKL